MPLLLAVGVLLIGIGAISWVYNPLETGDGGDGSGTANPAPAWASMLVLVVRYVAVPLGLLLMVGAFYFRMEIKRALQNKR